MRTARIATAGLLGFVIAAGCDPPAAGPDAGRVTPVSAATVARRDVPLFLDGLGSVVALKAVTVRTRIDGQLMKAPFREGHEVRPGQLLARIDDRPLRAQLHQAEGALARDTALLEDSRLNLTRTAHLLKRHLVAQENVDDQAALVGQYLGATRIDRGQIETVKTNLHYTLIRSPIRGVAGIRQVDPGNVVHPSDANGIVVLTQLDPIGVLFTLPQDELPQVSRALARGPLTVELLSRDGAALLGRGRVLLVDNQIDPRTATMRLKAVAPNPERLLWPNQFVKAHLHLTTLAGAIVLPSTAVQRGPQGPYTYVIQPDGTVVLRSVQIDLTQGDLTVIKSGLTPGERVVLEGQNQLAPGARVTVRDGGAGP